MNTRTAIAALFLLTFTAGAFAQSTSSPQPATAAELPATPLILETVDGEGGERSWWERWLEEVEPLITRREKLLFATLSQDYQREAFIHQFWRVRDPFPRTVRNELKERWPERVAQARANYDSLEDARATLLLTHGDPSAGFSVVCAGRRIAAEIWAWADGSDWVPFPFFVIFIRPDMEGPARVWRPGTFASYSTFLPRLRSCVNGERLLRVVRQAAMEIDSYDSQLQRILAKPRPSSEEWVDTFVAHSTDLPEGAEPLDGELAVLYPGRHRLRTVVQGLLTVPAAMATAEEYAGYRSYELQLTGEVIHDGSLFESFRYKYGFPADRAPATLPMAFQRFLRPGTYDLVVRLDDLNSDRVFRTERTLEVPRSDTRMKAVEIEDAWYAELFEEAAAAIEAGESMIRIIPPQEGLMTGLARFDTLVTGDQITKVRFYLDDRRILTKNRPPYNVEIDLGEYPDLHTLRVEALDATGAELAADEFLVNAGGYRFIAKLVEPRRGRTYEKSIRARVEVEVPEKRTLERVELYLNETLMATLYQEPFVHPLILPEGDEITYVRAVAYLPDGNSTEDMVFVNGPEFAEAVDVQFVELYTSVLDKQGRPVEGLGRGDFTVIEDGTRQEIRRFERVDDQSIHVGILIDNSASMVGTLGEVRKAALSFFQQAIQPKDRAAVITFNSFPHLAVDLTNDRTELGSGLAGLVPEGQTALYDSLMFALYYFTGIKGQRAVLLLSDGKDESSRFDFNETLDYARRAGITIYSIGFRLGDAGARSKLTRLADETGGRSFYMNDISQLENVYSQIQRELRSQYLIAYQSSNTADDGEFRSVDLKVGRSDVVVKTLSGYYP